MTVLRWFLFGTVPLAVMVAASMFAEPRGWTANLRWANERQASWARAAAECPVLDGEAFPGNAYAGYVDAARAAARLPDADRERLRTLAAVVEVEPELAAADRAMLRAWAPAVQVLRQAAHRLGGPEAWGRPGSLSADTELLDVPALVDALVVEARLHLRDGDPGAATACLLDGFALGIDLLHRPLLLEQLLGAMAVMRCAGAFGDPVLQACGADQLRRLASALALADAALPASAPVLEHAAVGLAQFLQDTEQVTLQDMGLGTPLQAWQHGFSARRFGMAHVAQYRRLQEELDRQVAEGEAGWPRRRACLQAIVDQDRAAQWGTACMVTSRLVEYEEQRREALAELRLLRLAVAFHRRDPLPAVADPLGSGTIRVAVTDEEAVFASAGPGRERRARRGP